MNTPKIISHLAFLSLTEEERASFYELPKFDDKHPRDMTFAEVGEAEWVRAGQPRGKKAEAWAKRFWEPFLKFRGEQPKRARTPEEARDGIVS